MKNTCKMTKSLLAGRKVGMKKNILFLVFAVFVILTGSASEAQANDDNDELPLCVRAFVGHFEEPCPVVDPVDPCWCRDPILKGDLEIDLDICGSSITPYEICAEGIELRTNPKGDLVYYGWFFSYNWGHCSGFSINGLNITAVCTPMNVMGVAATTFEGTLRKDLNRIDGTLYVSPFLRPDCVLDIPVTLECFENCCETFISFVKGDVKIIWDGRKQLAEKGYCLQGGDTVITGYNSSAEITFRDGTKLRLGENTRFLVKWHDPCLELKTFWGRIWARIFKPECFRVYTPNAIMAVRGTEFEVDVAEDGTTTVIVLDGVVDVCDLAGTKTVLVGQNQTTTVEPNGVPSDPQPIDPNQIDRWWDCVADSDSDGMDDCWEVQYGLNPDDPTDAELDNDGDGFTNLQEYNAGTNPNDPDDYPPPASSIEISVGWYYDDPCNPNDLTYEFELEVETDETVELVEFLTPAGKRFSIPNEPRNWSGDICTWYYHEDNAYCWGYEADFPNEANLADYGDGTYTITVHYQNDSNDQTTVWFGIPGTNDPIPQPMQKPVLTFPTYNGNTTSPVTFTWEPCTDANATSIWLGLEKEDADEEYVDIDLPVNATSSDPITLSEGTWEAWLCFDNSYDFNNVDGIAVEIGKYSESDSLFTVTNPADLNRNGIVSFADFAIFALAWVTEPGDAGWNPACDISDPNDNFIDMLDLDVLTDNWLAGL